MSSMSLAIALDADTMSTIELTSSATLRPRAE
jgi:hypothetical protein